jgi:hypothetical protein
MTGDYNDPDLGGGSGDGVIQDRGQALTLTDTQDRPRL